MNVKRYFAKDMQEAMDKIRKELGSDAVILSSKAVRPKGPFKLFSKKIMEVMVAYEAPSPVKPLPRFQSEPTYSRSEAMNAAVKSAELQELFEGVSKARNTEMLRAEAASETAREEWIPQQDAAAPEKPELSRTNAIEAQLDELHVMITRMGERFERMERQDGSGLSDEARAVLEHLVGCEVAPALAQEMVFEAAEQCQNGSLEEMIIEKICDRLGSAAPVHPRGDSRTVVLLLGATGVGKTTSLVKLAALFALRDKLKVGMINSDTYRISAQEQLKTYAEILGTPVSIIYSPSEITQALKEQEDRDIIFIDTAGKRPSDEKHKDEIMQLIELSEADEILLVISAPTSLRSLEAIIKNYSFLENYKLLITKMDEVTHSGVVLNACHLSGMPLSYIATGQNVPDDIEEANIKEIAGRLAEISL